MQCAAADAAHDRHVPDCRGSATIESLRTVRWGVAFFVGALVVGCAPLPPIDRTRVTWHPSANFDARKPNFVILHHTSDDTVDPALRTLTDPQRRVSAHYLIGRDGNVIQLVEESQRAWHAGASFWGGLTDLNSASIGIELDNNGSEPFAEAQLSALVVLLGEIVARHGLPPTNVLGHGDIAPQRKADPSRFFPWKRLAKEGFGLWCDAGDDKAVVSLDAALGLQAFGYDVSDVDAAIVAFKRHFAPDDPMPVMTSANLAQLRCLLDGQPLR